MFKIEPIKNLDDLMKVMILRGAVFMGEQNHAYNTEFDRNEFNNRIHLLAKDNDEPVASMRILKEGDSAKLERILVRKEYRGKGYANKLMDYAYDYCRNENIQNIYLFCKPQLEQYWLDQGYTNVCNKVLNYKGMTLIPVTKKLDIPSAQSTKSKPANDEIPQILRHEKGTWVNRNSGTGMAMPSKANQR